MILVTKGAAPDALALGVAATAADCAAYDGAPQSYKVGNTKFKFDRGIYGNAGVKQALKSAQHHKCCYCEARFDANYSGDVEHYRPKGAVGAGKAKVLPGYYWLTYAWSNLFYACADCNQYRKRAAFPVADETGRARSHHDDVTLETPLIMDPSGPSDPRVDIRFNRDVPSWTSSRGRETVRRLGLDREGLNLSRKRHFRLLDALCTIIRLHGGSTRPEKIAAVSDARRDLRDATLPTAEFSAASSDYLARYRALWDVQGAALP